MLGVPALGCDLPRTQLAASVPASRRANDGPPSRVERVEAGEVAAAL